MLMGRTGMFLSSFEEALGSLHLHGCKEGGDRLIRTFAHSCVQGPFKRPKKGLGGQGIKV
jgi:hypothetical protein